MATKIVTKNSSTASAVPTASDLVQGELAVNVADKRLFTEDNAGAIVELGTNPSGNVTFQDNGKAIFGAGSDLQIYHDGSNSYIDDTATGHLFIRSNGDGIYLRSNTNEEIAHFNVNGSVKAYYDNSLKLATTATGIDVTGTVTSTGILEASDGTTGEMQLGLGTALTTGAGTYDSTVRWNGSSGNLLFSQGAVEKMRIGNSGIDVTGTATMDGLVTQAAANTYPAGAAQIKSLAGDISYITNVGGNFLISNSSTTDQFVLSSAGRVGIGTSSPDNKLTIGDSSTVSVGKQWGMDFQDAAKGEPQAYIYAEGRYDANFNTDLTFGTIGLSGSATERLRIDSAGSTIIRSGNKLILNRTDNAIGGEMSYVAGTGFIFNDANGDGVSFNQGASNKVRIDSAGNLLVGTTNPAPVSNNVVGVSIRNFGEVQMSTNNQGPLYLNRKGTDGAIVTLRKENVDVGSIGTTGGNLQFMSGSVGVGVGGDNLYPTNGSGNSTDASLDIGDPSARFKDLYLSGNASMGSLSPGIVTISSGSYFIGNATNGYRFNNAANTSNLMILKDNGNLLVGTTGVPTTGGFKFDTGLDSLLRIGHASGVSSGSNYLLFYYGSSIIGSITQNGTSQVLYNISSDQRLKENIVDAPSASDDIDAIQVRSFDWKADGEHQKYGMIAQELQTVAPEAVHQPEDSEDMMGVDYSKLVPMLIKEIQSLRNRVAQLEE